MSTMADETLASLLERRGRESPDTAYCEFQGDVLTLGALNRRVNQLAWFLRRHGLRRGDRVALMLPSHPDHLIAIFALAKLGLVRVPVNVHLIGAPLEHAFANPDPRALIADIAYRETLDRIPSSLEQVFWRRADDAVDPFVISRNESVEEPGDAPGPDDIIALTPSSGTTGAPKGVLKSDRHMRAGPHTVLALTEAGPGDVFLFWESLHHGAGVAVAIAALAGGFRLAMVERFSASRFWDDARRLGVTHVHYLGSVLPMLLNQPPSAGDREHRVRVAWGGGCTAETWHAFETRFGVSMRQGYGLSELLTFVTLNRSGPAGSIGRPIAWYDLELVDEHGDTIDGPATGEVRIRSLSPALGFLGYFRNPEVSAATMDGDWFRTGDLASRDAEGNLFYAGRKKDMLRRRGINISAWEVEQVVLEHEAIDEVALIGVPSDLGEDDLKLFVRRVAGTRLGPLDLIVWCESRLPYFQVPRFVEFIDEFPKTPTQRIRKQDLSRATLGVWDLQTSGHVPAKRR